MSIFTKFNLFKNRKKHMLMCKKDLYKSTYNGNAFDAGKEYVVDSTDKDHVWLLDNAGQKFNLSKVKNEPYYFIGDYFRVEGEVFESMGAATIRFCPKCGADGVVDKGSKTEFGELFIADDTGSSTEYASACSIYHCTACGVDTMMESLD